MTYILDLTDGSWSLSQQLNNLLKGVPATDIQPVDIGNFESDSEFQEVVDYVSGAETVYVVMTDTAGGIYNDTLMRIKNSYINVSAYIALGI